MLDLFSTFYFVFSISVAFTSWIILCFVKGPIEESSIYDNNMKLNVDAAPIEAAIQEACPDKYDLYLNFISIFACIYALAKVSQYTQTYVVKYIKAKYCKNVKTNLETCDRLGPKAVKEIENLQNRVDILQQHNFEMEKILAKTRPTYNIYLSDDDDAINSLSKPTTSNRMPITEETANAQQNIYISNRHLHMTQQVFIRDTNMPLDMQNVEHVDHGAGGDFPIIWRKYLKMQKYAIQMPPPSSNTTTTDSTSSELANPAPLVFSTEDLHAMHSGFWAKCTIRKI